MEYSIDVLLKRYPMLEACKNDIINATELLCSCFDNGGKLLLCGNGGSCADCDHITGELLKGFLSARALSDKTKESMTGKCRQLSDDDLKSLQYGLPAISLCSLTALNTAFSNDVDAEFIFAQGVFALGKCGDCLMCISTSGNSVNVVKAAAVARSLGINVISLTGAGGGRLALLSDIVIAVPANETFMVQELHLPVYHYICAETERRMFFP